MDSNPAGSLWNFPGNNTEVGCHFLLQGIFPNPRDWTHISSVSCTDRWVLYHWASWEATHGHISRENHSSKRWTLMFIAALSMIAMIWKLPKCPSTEKWIKMWCIYIYNEIYSVIKKLNNVICSNMDGCRDYYIKWNKSKTNILWYRLYVESKTNDTNELIYKAEPDSQT